MKAATFLLFACLSAAGAASSDRDGPLAAAAESGRREAREALAELRSFREEALAAQRPLEEEISRLRADLREARGELRLLREARDSGEMALSELEESVSRLRATRETAESLLAEILADWSESPAAFGAPEERQAAAAWASSEEPPGALRQDALPLLDTILRQMSSAVGGRTGPLTVFSADGRRVSGTGIFIGPNVFLAGGPGQIAGPVDFSDPAFPRVVPSPGEEARRIQETARARGGFLPMDPTGGAALALRRAEPGLLAELQRGGIWIYPILLAALVAFVVAVVKAAAIARIRRAGARGRNAFGTALEDGRESSFATMVRGQPALLRPFWDTLRTADHRDAAVRADLVHARLIEIRLRLTRGLAALSVIAATAPLLGLLGTVTGMISTFRRITLFGAGDPQSLSGGISEALVTTKFGLIVAIPTFIAYAFLSRRAQGTVAALEEYADHFQSTDRPASGVNDAPAEQAGRGRGTNGEPGSRNGKPQA